MIRRLIVAVILLAVAASSRADVPDMRGHWEGQRVNINYQVLGCGFVVSMQRGHRFEGILAGLLGSDEYFTVRGNVNQVGVVDLTGMDIVTGNTLHAHGRVRCVTVAFGPTCASAIMALRFAVSAPDGTLLDRGIILAVQMFEHEAWDEQADFASIADDTWQGVFFGKVVDENGILRLMHEPETTAIIGILSAASVPNVVGTIRPQTFDTEMLAVTPDGQVVFLIGVLVRAVQDQPKMLVGTYKRWNSFFDVFTEITTDGSPTFVDQGTYMLTPAP